MTTNEQNNDSNWNWKDLIESAGGVSSVVKLLSMLKNAGGSGLQIPEAYVGSAVGMPMRSAVASAEEVIPTAAQAFYGLNDVVPLASQAFHGLTETLPIIAPEVAEVASLGPIGLGLAGVGAAAGGLYYLGKKMLDHNNNDRVAKSIVQHEETKHRRAKHLSIHMFSDDNWAQAGRV